MSKIVIIGAGAIGRGYLPWVFQEQKYDFIFIDTNRTIIEAMQKQKGFQTYRVRNNQLQETRVPVAGAYLPENFRVEEHPDIAAVFINVGPRHAAKSAKLVDGLKCPIILCENDPATVDAVKASTQLKNVYFAVPDVITSNTAPRHLLEKDPLSIVSEDGVLFIDEGAKGLEGDFSLISTNELLYKQWAAKLYLHNTPHCIAAYLGAFVGVEYVHEAMAVPEVGEIVQGSMEEMLSSLKLKWDIPHEFLDWYADKELARFRCQLLYDPISRVAREPLRKLEVDGRLIGAAQICLSQGFIPQNILIGIASALLFSNVNDADRHLAFMRRALSPTAFVTHILSMRKGEALEMIFEERLPKILEQLDNLLRITGRGSL
jgi:mannitol-1-phosphate/altronate dehydrogenase